MNELAKISVELDKASCAAKQTVQPTSRSLRGLDWLNFFLADVQTGVGPFLAIYLAGYGWNEERVGLALTVGGIAGILAQTPAGALVDQVHRKRTLIATGIGALALGGAPCRVRPDVLVGHVGPDPDRRYFKYLRSGHLRHFARNRRSPPVRRSPGT